MVSLTDDDKTQLGQLSDYLFSRQATILDQWLSKGSLDEGPEPIIDRSREEFEGQFLQLLHFFIQRITGRSQASDLVGKVDKPEPHPWQSAYSLAEWNILVDSFYGVLDEQIRQFLELYPQTQSQVITQAYSQLLQLLKEVNRSRMTHIDQVRETGADESLQTLRAALDNLQQRNWQRVYHLQQVVHDLRNSLGIISSATSLLQQPLRDDDRVQYTDMLNRNVSIAHQVLDQLLVYAQSEEGSGT